MEALIDEQKKRIASGKVCMGMNFLCKSATDT